MDDEELEEEEEDDDWYAEEDDEDREHCYHSLNVDEVHCCHWYTDNKPCCWCGKIP